MMVLGDISIQLHTPRTRWNAKNHSTAKLFLQHLSFHFFAFTYRSVTIATSHHHSTVMARMRSEWFIGFNSAGDLQLSLTKEFSLELIPRQMKYILVSMADRSEIVDHRWRIKTPFALFRLCPFETSKYVKIRAKSTQRITSTSSESEWGVHSQ